MKTAIEWIKVKVKSFCVATSQAFYVSIKPYRANRRLRYLESKNFELNNKKEILQEQVVSLNRRIKFQERDLRKSAKDLRDSIKQINMMKRWIVVMHRVDVPHRAGGIDELIAKANEIQESQSAN